MNHNLNFEMKLRDECADHVMSHTYSSYSEFKLIQEEEKLRYLIHRKYLKLLGKFIESTYPGLKFDVFIRHRDPKIKNPQWYGQTYMELRIFDVITVYEPHRFDRVFKTPGYEEYFYSEDIYNNIDSFIPEINKHLLITFRPLISPHTPIYNIDMFDPKPFECWGEYFAREYHRHARPFSYQDNWINPDRFGL